MERKSLAVEIKAADKGEVEAVFSKMGEVDHEGDLTLEGAFNDGAEVALGAYAHSSVMVGGRPPVGKGYIKVVGSEARFVGSYFMDQPGAREEFLAVKNLGRLLGWSYGYDIEERGQLTAEQKSRGARRVLAKLTVHEVSSTLVPAGRSTETVGVKRLARRRSEAPLLSLAFVKAACPPCGQEMERLGISAVRYKMLPEALLDSLCGSFGSGEEFHDACMEESYADIGADDKAEFCAWLQTECAWRAEQAAQEAARLEAMDAEQREAELATRIQADADAELDKFQRTRRRLGLG